MRGREIRYPGAGPLPAGAADDAGRARAAQPRLCPARDDRPVRRVQHRRRHRHLPATPPPPGRRIQEVPGQDRRERARRARGAPDLRQPGQLQDPRHPGLAGPPPPVLPALHADRLVVDQPGRAVVRLLDRSDDPPQRAQERASPRSRHPRLDRELERQPAAIRLDQDRRRDPGLTGKVSSTNFRRGIPERLRLGPPSSAVSVSRNCQRVHPQTRGEY